MTVANAIEATLIQAGVLGRQAQADVLCTSRVQWCKAITGRTPSTATIQAWLVSARVNGYSMVLRWTADGVVAELPPKSRPQPRRKVAP